MKKTFVFFLFFLPCLVFSHTHSLQLVKNEGNTLTERISVPSDFKRVTVKKGSFAEYLRNYPLKAPESPVLLYNQNSKNNQENHVAVFALPLGNSDIQHGTQSIIRLYSDYLLKIGKEDQISFHLTNGEICSWSDWYKKSKFKRNERVEFAGNLKKWTEYENPPKKSEIYKSYLKNIFANTNPLSIMEYESRQISMHEAQLGDILFDFGQSEHILLIVDISVDQKTGEKAFLFAQGSDPSAEFHIIKNPKRANDPWYHEEDFILPLQTPEHIFPKNSFRHLNYLD